TSSRLLQEAEGYKQRVIANSEGDASRFKQVLTEYAKAPQVTRERIYIDTMREVLSSTNKIMMDYRGSGNLLYLPLDKIMQQAGGAPLTESQAAQKPAEPPPAGEPGPIVAIVIVVLLLVSGTLYTVDQRQNAIVFQLGEVKEVVQKPGLHLKIPLLQNVRS